MRRNARNGVKGKRVIISFLTVAFVAGWKHLCVYDDSKVAGVDVWLCGDWFVMRRMDLSTLTVANAKDQV